MKRLTIIQVLVFLLSGVATAQVAKQVEVTKDYVPTVGQATKLPSVPNMTDTVTMRPEIDYTIAPRSFSSALGTHRIKPATATYWEYAPEYPFYMKLGVGYPLNSVADIYASTHRAGIGFVTGYVNHIGQYSKIKSNDADGTFRNNSQQLVNRVGVNAGKYFGKYTLAGDIYYQSDIYHRYPKRDYERSEINFEDINFKIRFGDSFVDLKHLNFDIHASVDFYNDKSETFADLGKFKLQQIDFAAGASLSRQLGAGRSRFSFGVDYRGSYGLKELSHYKNDMVSATLLYGYKSARALQLRLGFTYCLDHTTSATKSTRHYVIPHIYAGLNINNSGVFVPYIEVDGAVRNNSYYSLVRRNPYVAILSRDDVPLRPNTALSLPNTAQYDVRFGVSGHTRNSKFAYRFYANMSFIENSIYWYNIDRIFFNVDVARENLWSLNAEFDYKPTSQLLIAMRVSGLVYTNFADVNSAKPPVEANIRLRYSHSKFAIGASAEVQGVSKWTSIDSALGERYLVGVPATVDVGLTFDWYASKRCTVFVEGRNLANMNIYKWLYYREYGANFTAGVKLQF